MASHPILTSPGFLRAYRALARLAGFRERGTAAVMPAVPGEGVTRVAIYAPRTREVAGILELAGGAWNVTFYQRDRRGWDGTRAWTGPVEAAEARVAA